MTAFDALRSGCGVVHRALDARDLVGDDTPDFLNRLLTLDTRAMAEATCDRAFLLDAKGRVQVGFDLTRLGPTAFRATLAAGGGDLLAEKLDFYHFGERFECRPAAAPVTLCGPQAPALLREKLGRMPPEPGHWAGGVTHLPGWPVPVFQVDDLTLDDAEAAGATACPAEALEALRVALGVPAWPHEYGADFTPLDVAGVTGVTEGKGCYPGQEVIERTLAIGRPANKLAQVELSGPAEPGALTLDGAPAGKLTSAAEAQGAWVGLAVLKRKRAAVDSTLQGPGFSARVVALHDPEGAR